MKKLLITSLLAFPVLALAATPVEMETEGTKGVLAIPYRMELNKEARQDSADRWFSFDKGFRLSDGTRNRYWKAKDYTEYNEEYDSSEADDRLYKKEAGEVDTVYVPGVPHNVAMHPKNRSRLAYWMTDGYNGIYKKDQGISEEKERIEGKYHDYQSWDWNRTDGQEYKNMPDQDKSGNYKSLRWNPYRFGRYNYRRGEDASSADYITEAAE